MRDQLARSWNSWEVERRSASFSRWPRLANSSVLPVALHPPDSERRSHSDRVPLRLLALREELVFFALGVFICVLQVTAFVLLFVFSLSLATGAAPDEELQLLISDSTSPSSQNRFSHASDPLMNNLFSKESYLVKELSELIPSRSGSSHISELESPALLKQNGLYNLKASEPKTEAPDIVTTKSPFDEQITFTSLSTNSLFARI